MQRANQIGRWSLTALATAAGIMVLADTVYDKDKTISCDSETAMGSLDSVAAEFCREAKGHLVTMRYDPDFFGAWTAFRCLNTQTGAFARVTDNIVANVDVNLSGKPLTDISPGYSRIQRDHAHMMAIRHCMQN